MALVLGVLFLGIAVAGAHIKKLPLTTAIVYLISGVMLGPAGLKLLVIDPVLDRLWIERIAQIAICIALFSAGLKLRASLSDRIWFPAIRLSTLSVVAAVLLAALAGVIFFHLSWGMAIVLGAILAPTDPVLASDVELERPSKEDRLRFTFTGEAALNDCTASPFLALGLGLLQNDHAGFSFLHWALKELFLSTAGGLVLGAVTGAAAGAGLIYLRRQKNAAIGFDDFVVLGLIAFSFACAVWLNVNGILAVFTAGVALRQLELRAARSIPPAVRFTRDCIAPGRIASDPEQAAPYLAHTSLEYAERIGHLGELAIVVMIGALISSAVFTRQAILFTGIVFLLVRPLSVGIGLLGSRSTVRERSYLSWFGVRGAASLYYLMAAERSIRVGNPNTVLIDITLVMVTTSIMVHGVTVSPLTRLYTKATNRVTAIS